MRCSGHYTEKYTWYFGTAAFEGLDLGFFGNCVWHELGKLAGDRLQRKR